MDIAQDFHVYGSPNPLRITLAHTTLNTPYIALTTRSAVPIYLTVLKPSDAPKMAATLSIKSINDALVSVPVDYTVDSAHWWIDQQLSGKYDLPLTCLRASDPENGPFIGTVALAPHDSDRPLVLRQKTIESDEEGRDVDLGYYLHPEWRGKGIMKAGVEAIVNWGREYERVRTVVVKVLEENVASRKIIESFPQFQHVNGNDEFIDWPELKGGGKRKIFVFEWKP